MNHVHGCDFLFSFPFPSFSLHCLKYPPGANPALKGGLATSPSPGRWHPPLGRCRLPLCSPKVVAGWVGQVSPPIFSPEFYVPSSQIILKIPSLLLIFVDIFIQFGIFGMALMQIFVADGNFVVRW